ncbi:fatty acid-binding protein, liver-like [Diabrotica undecimpunctata]|uniref:fatty acid-binding protein, liver-like n=1 Tax=Diabrotica undecimpunctata TaxID=50387 RepID=UPI003B641C93
MVLNGKYTVVGEENFANYLSAMGFPYNYVKYSIDIKQDSDKVTVIKSYDGKSKAVVIPLGVEYEETNALGVVVKCMARFDGDILIVQAGDVTKTYTFTPTDGNIVYKSPISSGKLIFKSDQ